MTAPASPTFRGSAQLAALISRMQPLASFLTKFKPECRVLTLSQRDFEILRKYPEAAQLLYDITTSPTTGVTYWRGFWELRPEPSSSNPKPQMKP